MPAESPSHTSSPLASSRFLDGLPEAVRRQVVAQAWEHEFLPGAVFFSEGAAHRQIYLIQSGLVRLSMWVPRRGRMPLLTVGPGELLGWSPLLGDQPMTATAVALEPVRALVLDGPQLRSLCESDPAAGCQILRQVALALSNRLLATRLQLLDLFSDQQAHVIEETHG